MSTWEIRYRTIVYDKDAEKEVEALKKTEGKEFEDKIMASEWLLTRKPDAGTPQKPTDKRNFLLINIQSRFLDKSDDFFWLYSYNDCEITIHGVNLIKGAGK